MATDYTELVTSQHRKPRFLAYVAMMTEALGKIQDVAASLKEAFNVDVAVGQQLDIIGLWVGVTRRLEIPLASSFFSFNTAGLGFNQGVWFTPFTPSTGLVFLDDETYRLVIKAMILANRWDGTLRQYQIILQEAFPDHVVWAVDNTDRTLTIHATGNPMTAIQSAILQSGPISKIKPAGISIAGYVLPT